MTSVLFLLYNLYGTKSLIISHRVLKLYNSMSHPRVVIATSLKFNNPKDHKSHFVIFKDAPSLQAVSANDLVHHKSGSLMFNWKCVNSLSNMCSQLNKRVLTFVKIIETVDLDC